MRTLWTLLAAVAIAACAWDQPNPDAYKPTKDNPCGNLGVPCFDMQGNYDHMCCNEGETCGGGKWSVGCPAGSCCDIRDNPPLPGLSRDADASAPLPVRHTQRPEQ